MSDSAQDRADVPTLVAAAGEDASDRRLDVGVLIAHAPGTDPDSLRTFARDACRDAVDELASATDVAWRCYTEHSSRLADHARRRPSKFLDRATQRMVEGPYDLVVVVTDVALVSSRERVVPGLASPLARVAVVSTHHLRNAPRGEPRRSLDDVAVRWNAATLLVHLVDHLLGARHGDGGAMVPFEFDPNRRSIPAFDADAARELHRVADEVPAEDARPRGPLGRFAFHAGSVARNPG